MIQDKHNSDSNQIAVDDEDLILDNISNIDHSIVNSENNVIVDKLIAIIIKKHDKGIALDQIEYYIEQPMLKLNQSIYNLLNWLIKNQDTPQHIWFLGIFYYYNIGVDENSSKAFEFFLKQQRIIVQLHKFILLNVIMMDMELNVIKGCHLICIKSL